MPAVLTGTPSTVTTSGTSVTVPADATAAYMFWAYWSVGAGDGMSSVTLGGASADENLNGLTSSGNAAAGGVFAWYNPSTGSQTLNFTNDTSMLVGPTIIVVYVKDGNTTAWTDADQANSDVGASLSATVTTSTTDLVIGMLSGYNASPPALESGYTSAATQTNNDYSARAIYQTPSGSSLTANSQGQEYQVLTLISIPEAAGGGGSILPLINAYYS